jgi:hypothetical protein
MTNNRAIAKSSIAAAMGARISVTGPGRGMYLVIGRSTSFDSVVKNAGGEVILRLNGCKMLVTLSFDGYLSLRGSRHLSNIGPVNVDVKRLARVSDMLAKTSLSKHG